MKKGLKSSLALLLALCFALSSVTALAAEPIDEGAAAITEVMEAADTSSDPVSEPDSEPEEETEERAPSELPEEEEENLEELLPEEAEERVPSELPEEEEENLEESLSEENEGFQEPVAEESPMPESTKEKQTITGTARYTVTYGVKPFALDATSNVQDAELSYTSSFEPIATVNQNGVVTPHNYGAIAVTVTAAETETHAAAKFSVIVVINRANQTVTGASNYTTTYGAKPFALEVKSNGNGALSYRSANPAAATVSRTGVVTPVAGGLTAIIVTAARTGQYNASAPFKIVVKVNRANQSITGVAAVYERYYKKNSTFTLPARSVCARTFRSSNPSVATVGKATGLVTIKGMGKTTITVVAAENGRYKGAKYIVTLCVYKRAASIGYSSSYKKSKYYTNLTKLKLSGSSRQNILSIAYSQLGYHEGSSSSRLTGSGSSSGNYTEYGRYFGINPGAWCAMFVNWCARENGVSTSDIPKSSWVPSYYNYYHRKGQHYYSWKQTRGGSGSYIPKAGDLIFYSAAYKGECHHVGYVTNSYTSGNYLVVCTIEGNSSDRVRTHTMKLKIGSKGLTGGRYINGFAHPNY